MNEPKPIEQQGKEFADSLLDVVETSGVQSELTDPKEAFMSGCYFGATQGYKRGVNFMLVEAINHLPDIYNMIVESGHDMSINWVEEYKKLLIKNIFGA